MVNAKMRPLFLCSVILYHGNTSLQQLLNMLRNLFQKQENVLIGLRTLLLKNTLWFKCTSKLRIMDANDFC